MVAAEWINGRVAGPCCRVRDTGGWNLDGTQRLRRLDHL